MADLHELGETVPGSLFAASLDGAVRAARTGRSVFAPDSVVEVRFTITSKGTDVDIAGFCHDDPGGDSGLRVVGDTLYQQSTSYQVLPTGDLRLDKRWVMQDLTSTDSGDRFMVALGVGTRGIGTPLGLIQGIVESGNVVVVASDSQTSTFRGPMRTAAVERAYGRNVTAEGIDPAAFQEVLIAVDARGLPSRIETDVEDVAVINFGDWGDTAEVAPPAEEAMTFLEWSYFLSESLPE